MALGSIIDRTRRDPALTAAVTAIAAAWLLGLVHVPNSYLRAALGVTVAVAFVVVSLVRPEAALVSFVGVMPLRDLGRVVPWATTDFATVIALAGLAGLVMGAYLAQDDSVSPRLRTPLALALGGPWVAALVTTPFSLLPARSFQYAWRFLWLWAGALLFAVGVTTTARLRLVLRALVLMCCALTGLVGVQALLGPFAPGRVLYYMNGSYVWVTRPAGFYLDPNFTAVLLACGAVAAAALALDAVEWRVAWPWALAAAICLAGVALTGSRTALLSIAGAAVVIALTAPRGRRALAVAVLAVGLVASIALVPQTLARVKSVATDSSEPSLQTRLLMSESMVEMLPRFWLTGTGLQAFEQIYPGYRKPGALPRVLQPHDVPLAMWLEMGIPGLLAELAIAVSVVLALRRRIRRGWLAEDSAVLAVFAVVAVGAIFQYFYYFEPFWFAAGLLAASPSREA